MTDTFAPIPEAAKSEYRQAYREFLAVRDGDVDVSTRQLSKREASMRRFVNVANKRSLDRSLFDAQYSAFDANKKTPLEMVLLLALVKTNAAESYGVNRVFEKTLQRVLKNKDDDLELVLLMEEGYHTRILLSSANIYGIEVTDPYTPPLGVRTLIGILSDTPHTLSRPLLLASELLGTILFSKLLYRCRELFKHDAEVRDAIEERVTEVLIDEIGHVSFNRLCLGSFGMMQARAVMPLAARGMADAIPEFKVLDLKPSPDVAALSKLPEEVRRRSFIV